MTGITVLLIALVAVVAVGLLLKSRSGAIRASGSGTSEAVGSRIELLAAAGIAPGSGPVVLHFSADWCGPCSAVRRVVDQVVTTMANAPHPPVDVELDIDKNPALAREMSVLSLPTTFILDRDLVERFRVSGVPSTADLTSALAPFSTPGTPNSPSAG
ncbi:thioredoxin family protein [Rhodococcus globerulus]|uniref:thioredoxin family protein n=1 Tax=Rhodococcus globerulus TaxID=33008 RepID=UPI000E227AA3|nr:thioredoxin family protein [Rhodococcus globerulus]MCE4264534.1 thioredoxin family protein [Rhodococcus globerulus]